MKIEGKHAADIDRVWECALQDGMRYVSLHVGKNDQFLQAETMQFFDDKSAAGLYTYMKRMVDQEYLTVLPILPLQQLLQRNMELQQMTRAPGQEPTDIAIDTGHILLQERARLDIFTREISKQLREYDIKPDLTQLIENIRDDKQRFEIAGIRRVDGMEMPYVISIEQNESRAFMIGAVEFRQSQQQIKGYIQSDVLEGTVRREDALEIKNMLQQEKESGNRFVSFPGEWNGLKKDDFTAFRSAFSALEYAYENMTDRDRHIVRSIPVVEKEINNLLENKKEQDRSLQNEREEKPSRGQEISR